MMFVDVCWLRMLAGWLVVEQTGRLKLPRIFTGENRVDAATPSAENEDAGDLYYACYDQNTKGNLNSDHYCANSIDFFCFPFCHNRDANWIARMPSKKTRACHRPAKFLQSGENRKPKWVTKVVQYSPTKNLMSRCASSTPSMSPVKGWIKAAIPT